MSIIYKEGTSLNAPQISTGSSESPIIDPNFILYPSNAFYRSHVDYALDWLEESVSIGQADPWAFAFMGDSLIGYSINEIIQLISNQYDLNGLGFDAFDTYSSQFVTSTLTNMTLVEESSDVNLWGFAGRSYVGTSASSSSISYQPVSVYRFNDFKLFYNQYSGGGQFRYRIDGGAWTTVDTSGASALGIVTENNIGGLDYTNSLIEIEVTSGTVRFHGIVTYNGHQGGILPLFINEGGTKAQDWASKMTYVQDFLDEFTIKQIHVWFGANDANVSRTKAEFKADLNTILGSITLQNEADFILYTTTRRGLSGDLSQEDTAFTAIINEYRDAKFEIANSNNYTVFDLYVAWPSYTIAYNEGWYDDNIHPSIRGAVFNGLLITDVLLPKMFDNKYQVNDSLKNFFLQRNFVLEAGKSISGLLRTSTGAPNLFDVNNFTGVQFDDGTLTFYKKNAGAGSTKRQMMTFYNGTDNANRGVFPTSTFTRLERIYRLDSLVNYIKETNVGTGGDVNNIINVLSFKERWEDGLGATLQEIDANSSGGARGVRSKLSSYTVGTLPSASDYAQFMIYVSDESGGAVPAFSDGTNWRRVTDRAIVS